MVAGLVVIGGSAVGGVALAANRTDDSGSSVQPHATPTRSADDADDHGNNRGNDNESTEDRHGGDTATPTISTTCDRDADEVAGDRHGDPNAPDDDAVSGDRHGGDGGGHHDGRDDCR